MEETQWIDWHPKVGDIKPALYRVKGKSYQLWEIGAEPGKKVTHGGFRYCDYQIPAPVVTPPEDRPPWIDPQCKFRWGDRVKDIHEDVWYVINPQTAGGIYAPVLVARSLSAAVPYCTAGELIDLGIFWDRIDEAGYIYMFQCFHESDLTLFPEELPRHFDDRLLDADQPQQQINTARVPREIWVTSYGGHLGPWYYPSLEAALEEESSSMPIHFREVLSDGLTNIQYSPGG